MALRQYTNIAIYPWANYDGASGKYFAPPVDITTLALGNNILRAFGTMFPRTVVVDRLGMEVVTASDTTALCRLGVYSDSSGLPNTLLLDAGITSAFSTTGWFEVTTSFTFVEFTVYWLAVCTQNVAQNSTAYSGSPTLRVLSGNAGFQNVANLTANEINAGAGALHTSAVTGALPSPFTSTAGTGNNVQGIRVGYRVA